MANLNPASTIKKTVPKPDPSGLLTHIPGVKAFNNLDIGSKLNIGFGILVLLTLLVVGLISVASQEATQKSILRKMPAFRRRWLQPERNPAC
jgi:hypothetical protein